MKKLFSVFGVFVLPLFIAGCAKSTEHARDPYERLNRKTFAFNQAVDKVLLKPVATVYTKVIPTPVRKASNNFYNNLALIPTVANDLLQADFRQAIRDTTRFVFNSTVGIAGLIDVASNCGLPARYNDFGITLAKWGDVNSPYLVLPFIGPSTLRDAVGLPITMLTSVYPYIRPDELGWAMSAHRFIILRANLLENEDLLETAGVDPYALQRSVYLQSREHRYLEKRDDEPSSHYIDEDGSVSNGNTPQNPQKT